QTGRFRTVIEHVTEMGITAAALDRRSLHPQAEVGALNDVPLLDWLPETRPPGPRIELGLGTEERGVAADAAIQTLVVQVPGGAREGTFGTLMTRHFERDRRQQAAPLVLAFHELRDLSGFPAHTGIRVLD